MSRVWLCPKHVSDMSAAARVLCLIAYTLCGNNSVLQAQNRKNLRGKFPSNTRFDPGGSVCGWGKYIIAERPIEGPYLCSWTNSTSNLFFVLHSRAKYFCNNDHCTFAKKQNFCVWPQGMQKEKTGESKKKLRLGHARPTVNLWKEMFNHWPGSGALSGVPYSSNSVWFCLEFGPRFPLGFATVSVENIMCEIWQWWSGRHVTLFYGRWLSLQQWVTRYPNTAWPWDRVRVLKADHGVSLKFTQFAIVCVCFGVIVMCAFFCWSVRARVCDKMCIFT